MRVLPSTPLMTLEDWSIYMQLRDHALWKHSRWIICCCASDRTDATLMRRYRGLLT